MMNKIGFFGNFDKQKLFSFNNVKPSECCFFDYKDNLESIAAEYDFWIYFQKNEEGIIVSVPPFKPIIIKLPQEFAEGCVNSLLAYNKSMVGIDLTDIFSALGTGDPTFFLSNLSEADFKEQMRLFSHIKGAYILFKLPKSEENIFEKVEDLLSRTHECCDKETYIAYSVIIDPTVENFVCDLIIARP